MHKRAISKHRSTTCRWLFALLLGLILWRPGASYAGEGEAVPLRVDQCAEPKDSSDASSAEELQLRRTEQAGESYDRGLVLYEEGDYRAAVDAFVASYCRKAHPSAFYNIAQSYERLLNFELSIRYFERYVAEADPKSSNRKKAELRADVLRKLPAQLRVATMPEGAAITIRSASGVSARGTANASDPIEVTQGRYTMHIELPGAQSVSRDLVVKPGQPYSYYVRLEAETAALSITAFPANGRIFLGDRLVGVGSYSEALAVGNYQITVEAPGRIASKQMVRINADQPISMSIVLERKKNAGRTTLIAGSTIGLGIGGALAFSKVFNQDAGLTLAASVATTGLGFGGAYFGIPETLTLGDAWFVLGASAVGLIEGAFAGSFFACDRSQETTQFNDCSSAAVTGAALAGSVAGAIAATLTYQRLELSTADMAVLGSGAFWGLGAGTLFFAVFDSDARIRDPILLAGINLGLISAAGLIANSRVSLRRIAIIDLAGVGGVLAGVSSGQAFGADNGPIRHLAILGGLTGLIVGTFLTRYMDEDRETKSAEDSLLPVVGASRGSDGSRILSLGISSSF